MKSFEELGKLVNSENDLIRVLEDNLISSDKELIRNFFGISTNLTLEYLYEEEFLEMSGILWAIDSLKNELRSDLAALRLSIEELTTC